VKNSENEERLSFVKVDVQQKEESFEENGKT
jgi:hypothetical protein